MESHEQPLIVSLAVTEPALESVELFSDVAARPGGELGRAPIVHLLDPTKPTTVAAAVSNDQRDDVIVHMPCIRRQNGEFAAKNLMQLVSTSREPARLVGSQSSKEGPGLGGQGRSFPAELLQDLGPLPERFLNGPSPEGLAAQGAVRGIGWTGQVIFAVNPNVVSVLTERVVDPIIAIGTFEVFQRVRPIWPAAGEALQIAGDVELQHQLGRSDLNPFTVAHGKAALGRLKEPELAGFNANHRR
jgi:hypothetical protein